MTQNEEVIEWLKEHQTISTMECATQLFIADLQSIIRNLKKKMPISYKWIYTCNKYGRPIRYKRYKFTEKNDIENGYIPYGEC